MTTSVRQPDRPHDLDHLVRRQPDRPHDPDDPRLTLTRHHCLQQVTLVSELIVLQATLEHRLCKTGQEEPLEEDEDVRYHSHLVQELNMVNMVLII